MNKAEIQSIIENRFGELGAYKVTLHPSGDCWTLHDEFFRIQTLSYFWVLEWTDNISYAANCCFEDVDLMPYDISVREIIKHVDSLLVK